MLHGTPSWGQPVCVAPGCNPTASDDKGNTAGGSSAFLKLVDSGSCGVEAGCGNTAFGAGALNQTTTGMNNTAFGFTALGNNLDDNNTAVGYQALQNSTGASNTAVGYQVLQNNTGANNTASGAHALQGVFGTNTGGGNNTATGASALQSNGTGNLNTATGFQALENNSDGANNTAVGAKALKKSLGTKNIGIGYQAGVTLTTGNNNIFIGNQGAGDESKTIRIGTAQTQTFIAGIAGNTSVSNASPVVIDVTTGQLGIATVVSSARYKRDIAPMGSRSEDVLKLRPVTFVYKADAQGVTHYGLIAEEVQKVYPELVTRTPTGEVQGILYQELIPMLLNEVQRQREALQSQHQALQRQQQELADLRALVGQGRGAEAVIPSMTVAESGTGSLPR